jgi:hypothetical protein
LTFSVQVTLPTSGTVGKILKLFDLSYNFFFLAKFFDSPFLYRATKEQEERILLFAKKFKKIAKERGYHAAKKEAFAAYDFFNALYVCILFT